jgi:hypothetical protein
MWRSMLKVAAAVGGFGLVHSALASRAAKRTAAETFGERNRNGLYRVFYIGQSLVSFARCATFTADWESRQAEGKMVMVASPTAGGWTCLPVDCRFC